MERTRNCDVSRVFRDNENIKWHKLRVESFKTVYLFLNFKGTCTHEKIVVTFASEALRLAAQLNHQIQFVKLADDEHRKFDVTKCVPALERER